MMKFVDILYSLKNKTRLNARRTLNFEHANKYYNMLSIKKIGN